MGLSKDNHSSSLFALTFNEIQTRSGMNFETMNIDELLNSVASEDFQVSSNVDQNPPPFSVPTPLSGKTIDEVFAAIQENSQPQQNNGGFDFSRNEYVQLERLGEMTLEEFLIAAGVIVRPPSPDPLPLPMQEQGINLNDLPPPSGGNFFSNGGSGVSVGPAMGYNVGSGNNGNGVTNSLMSDGSSPFNNMFNVGGGSGGGCNVGEPSSMVENGKSNNNVSIREKRIYRKRKVTPIPMVMDPAEERRHRRLIKNRESAAKSRARKLEYTIQLQKDLDQKRLENKRLKFALKQAEKKLKQEEDAEKEAKMKGGFGSLRRTKSASW